MAKQIDPFQRLMAIHTAHEAGCDPAKSVRWLGSSEPIAQSENYRPGPWERCCPQSVIGLSGYLPDDEWVQDHFPARDFSWMDVTQADNMLGGNACFSTIGEITFPETVTSLRGTFSGLGFNTDRWVQVATPRNTSQVKRMDGLFAGARLAEVPFIDMSSVENLTDAFNVTLPPDRECSMPYTTIDPSMFATLPAGKTVNVHHLFGPTRSDLCNPRPGVEYISPRYALIPIRGFIDAVEQSGATLRVWDEWFDAPGHLNFHYVPEGLTPFYLYEGSPDIGRLLSLCEPGGYVGLPVMKENGLHQTAFAT